MALTIICAWCKKTLGTVQCGETGVTHGICPKCEKKVVEKEIKPAKKQKGK